VPGYHRFIALCVISIVFVGFLRLPAVERLVEETPPAPIETRPRLVVMVVFDQLRGDYLEKWRPLFIEGGFKRLQTEGASFTNCHYPYCYTLTAPGHTSLVTGTYPSRHGIVSNDWYDRANADTVTSVTPPPDKIRSGLGPYRRQVRTIGDVLLDVLAGRGRVASLSIKDRAAILMAALRAQICYWVEPRSGQFVTSPYYRDEPHSWAKAFNAGHPADQFVGRDWVRSRTDLDYEKYSSPDDFFAEGIGYGQGQVFPHPTTLGVGPKAKDRYYKAMENSPFGNDLLFDFAKTAIISEKLGQTDAVDLLCLSFSSNDLVGHCWGPDSQEVLDITLRSDRMMKDLLDFLDAKVGKGNYVFAVSADHGVCPLPEFAAKEGKNSGRAAPEILTSLAEAHLNSSFLPKGGKESWFEVPNKYNPWIYLNRPLLRELNLEHPKVERVLADWMSKQTGISNAFTRTEIISPDAAEPGSHLDMVRKSFRPEASGDVMVVLEKYHLFSSPLLSKDPAKIESYRTTHGTLHAYDTHVPLLVMGPRIQPGNRSDRIAPQAMAAILAECLRIPPPNGAEFPVPPDLFKK